MLKELNTVVNYIESHLCDTLTVKQLAAEANMSEFQLHQVFYYLAGMTLTEYIKRRRLSEANLALLAGQKVTDVAYDFGYDSVDGFSRAFKRWTGFLPSDVTKSALTKVLPVLNFSIQVNG
ncbi:AraC family transcriptional regulator, partial [Escherichia coli]|uniref:helix-turn-helix domain-containing protein n=1 Tax=Escherichia coli TaxID=562 RepID=UPI0030C6A0EB